MNELDEIERVIKMSENLNTHTPNINDTINYVSEVLYESNWDSDGNNIILEDNHIKIIKDAYEVIINNLDYYVISVNDEINGIIEVNDTLSKILNQNDSLIHKVTHHTICYIYHTVVKNFFTDD